MANWEISWEHLLPLPPVRNQGNVPSCSMEAMMYSAQVINGAHIRRGILVPEISTFHHDSFRVDFELSTGTPIGAWWSQFTNWRVPTSLDIFLNHGVAAVNAPSWYGYEPVHISSYQAHDRVSFTQIMHYVSVCHPVLVIFPVAPDFGSFPPGEIYGVSADTWQRDRNQISDHTVMVYGCGLRNGFPYLKYLNTYGWLWGNRGTGKVWWNQVYQRPGTELVVYTMEMNGVTVPVPPYSPPPATPPPPDYPDSPCRAPDMPSSLQPSPPDHPESPPSQTEKSSRKRAGDDSGERNAGSKKGKLH